MRGALLVIALAGLGVGCGPSRANRVQRVEASRELPAALRLRALPSGAAARADLLRQAEAIEPPTVDSALLRGRLLESLGDRERAMKWYAAAAGAEPARRAARAGLVRTAAATARWQSWVEFTDLNRPRGEREIAARAIGLATVGRARDGRALLREGLDRQPGNATLLAGLAGIALASGDTDRAVVLARLAGIDGGAEQQPLARLVLGAALARRADPEAEAVLADVVEAAPQSPVALVLARLRLALGQPDGALSLLERWLADHPRDALAARLLGAARAQHRALAALRGGS